VKPLDRLRLPLLFVVTGFLLFPSPASLAEVAEETSVGPAVERILGYIEEREGPKYWTAISQLEALGKEAVPALSMQLGHAGEKSRLACAKAIVTLAEDEGVFDQAISSLTDLATTAKSHEVRVAAIEILGQSTGPDEAMPVLQRIFAKTTDPRILIPLARTLWEVDHVIPARDKLIDLLGSHDLDVKEEAALALAEIDYYEGEVRNVLRTLKQSPSSRGRRAAQLNRILQLSRQLDRRLESGEALLDGVDLGVLVKKKEAEIRDLELRLENAGKSSGSRHVPTNIDAVFEEVVLHIQKSYVDASKIERKTLVLGALRGMVRSLDSFSSFMDTNDTKAFHQSMSGTYFGIGAQVDKHPGGPLLILKPIYGGPAYEMGILSGDQILEVDGVRTDKLRLKEITGKLKGHAGTNVVLRVFRRGWDEPKELTVERRQVDIAAVSSEILPGKIGYLRLDQFGKDSASAVHKALNELEKEGMAGLVIDLRNNPGGYLDQAVDIVDEFVMPKDEELPIVTQKGRGRGKNADEVATHPSPTARSNYPIVVLINEHSASASEVVSGALQDFNRAQLVGEKTFGKGSVQRLIPLSSESQKVLGGESQLRMTVQYYFLPLGRCIHTIRGANGTVVEEGGVEPDIEVKAETVPPWRMAEGERMRADPLVLDYALAHWDELKHLFLEGDQHDTGRYTGLDELHKTLKTAAPLDDLRKVVRYQIRRRLEDQAGKEFASDFQEDVQLQRAILELLGKLGKPIENYPRYAVALKKPGE
jgi:carboxyl-terminal processing protease